MSVFGSYANFYDLLYRDKDYLAEVDFIEALFKKYSNGKVKTVLDMGCGTGGHALLLAERGYNVTGVDRSEAMLSIAEEKARKINGSTEFSQVDIRDFDLNKKFDAVISMFAVMGYQTTNHDFEAALASVYRHLNSDGIFIFDVWFGPAVLTQKPTDKLKTIEYENKKIIRYAHPVLDIISQTVEVNYAMFETEGDKILAETKESHLMRFFFYQELKYFLEKSGFEVLIVCPFMNFYENVDETCWNISLICKKVFK